jgi:hypothetical protein
MFTFILNFLAPLLEAEFEEISTHSGDAYLELNRPAVLSMQYFRILIGIISIGISLSSIFFSIKISSPLLSFYIDEYSVGKLAQAQ